jgi:hypothetical protein
MDSLTNNAAERKATPMARGLLDYFPAALAYVARVSLAANEKHNPGEEMHHARGKSMDHADCAVRHLIDRGGIDPDDNLRHTGKAAWRILALLQEELEEQEAAPLPRGARLPAVEPAAWGSLGTLSTRGFSTAGPVLSPDGWFCGCGEDKVWHAYFGSNGHERILADLNEIMRSGPLCDNSHCTGRMFRRG